MVNKETTKLTLENSSGTYTIEYGEDLAFIDEYITLLVIPMLLAAGFQPSNINERIKSDAGDLV